jgi:hypothetical protein
MPIHPNLRDLVLVNDKQTSSSTLKVYKSKKIGSKAYYSLHASYNYNTLFPELPITFDSTLPEITKCKYKSFKIVFE